MYKVMLDPGHGGTEPGAVNQYAKEKDINLQTANYCKDFLSDYPEIQAQLTRRVDTNVGLTTRGEISNAYQANLFVSMHNNAGGGDGFEVYHYTGSLQGKIMAELLAEEFSIIGQNKRFVGCGLYAGTKPGNYTVLEAADAPAVLGEFGFMDTRDYTQFDEKQELREIGKAYGKAILRYFNIDIKPEPEQVEECNCLETRVTKLEEKVDILAEELHRIKLQKTRRNA